MTRPRLTKIAAYRRPDPERRATAAEYALVASPIGVAVIRAITALEVADQGLLVVAAGV